MISSSAIYAGVALGLVVAVPIGPMGMLCIQRTVTVGWGAGLITGLAAALVLTLWAGIVLFGMGHGVTVFALPHSDFMSVCSGVMLLFFAARILQQDVASITSDTASLPSPVRVSLFSFFWGATAVALINPLTVVLLTAAIPAFTPNIKRNFDPQLVLGVFVGSVVWWIVLSSTIASFRHKLDTRLISWVNNTVGLILLVMAILSISSAII